MLVPTGNRPSPAPGAQASTVSGWRVGDIAIDVGEARATVRGEAVELDRSGHALLLHLVEHAGQVVGKDDLLRVGWPGRVVSENSLAKAISKLRQALGDDDGTLIRVVHGYGYRFSAAAEAIRLPPQSAPTVGNTIRHKLAMGLAAAAIAAAALMFALRGASPPTVPPDAAAQSGVRIAVVPFRDLSADQSLALLADGFATHLRDQIQRVPNLRHLPRSEVVPFGKDVRDAAEIAGDLGVDLLVSGAVDRNRDHLQVTLRLYDARERRPLLEQRFARAPADQASLQQDALAALLDRLGRHPGTPGIRPGQRARDPPYPRLIARSCAPRRRSPATTIRTTSGGRWRHLSRQSNWIRNTPMPGSCSAGSLAAAVITPTAATNCGPDAFAPLRPWIAASRWHLPIR
jgi:DNA-binding winged helix-turn-helix (wHTH) protein/TolB-like protein